jgi:1,4-alpha-glucan branching enzyme
MTAYFLLMPGIPMLFQGQEFGASSPFFYFADHETELSHNIREGRRRDLAQFPSLATSEMRAELADPGDIDTFRRSVHAKASASSGLSANTVCQGSVVAISVNGQSLPTSPAK